MLLLIVVSPAKKTNSFFLLPPTDPSYVLTSEPLQKIVPKPAPFVVLLFVSTPSARYSIPPHATAALVAVCTT
jgi:hypothetical protein